MGEAPWACMCACGVCVHVRAGCVCQVCARARIVRRSTILFAVQVHYRSSQLGDHPLHLVEKTLVNSNTYFATRYDFQSCGRAAGAVL